MLVHLRMLATVIKCAPSCSKQPADFATFLDLNACEQIALAHDDLVFASGFAVCAVGSRLFS
jgi:hypothetical protein